MPAMPVPPRRGGLPPSPASMSDQTAFIVELAMAIDTFGLEAFPDAVAELADRAREVAPTASRILADAAETVATRERAFAEVCLALTRIG